MKILSVIKTVAFIVMFVFACIFVISEMIVIVVFLFIVQIAKTQTFELKPSPKDTILPKLNELFLSLNPGEPILDDSIKVKIEKMLKSLYQDKQKVNESVKDIPFYIIDSVSKECFDTQFYKLQHHG